MRYLGVALLLVLSAFAQADVLDIHANEALSNHYQQNKQAFQQLNQQQQQRWFAQHSFQKNDTDTSNDFSELCLPYKQIEFVDFHLIDPTPFALRPDECINEARLNQLSRSITQAYVEKGYIHNPFQFEDHQTGNLILRVTEGKVSQIRAEAPLNTTMLFPNLVGKPLNIHDLDQGLDQANRLAMNEVSVDVLPSSNGEIELVFVNEPKSPISGFIGLDNNSIRQYDRWQARMGLTWDNPLGLEDSLYLGLNHTLNGTNRNVSRSSSLFYSVPYGYWTFNAYLSASQFHSDLPLTYHTVRQKGRTIQSGLKADYVVSRGSNYISTLSAALDRVDSKVRFESGILALQSPKYTSTTASFNHLQLIENGSISANVSYKRGLKWDTNVQSTDRNQPQAQFNLWQASADVHLYPRWREQIFHQQHRLTMQYSNNYLPAIEQADLTSRYAVRGFNDYSWSAEKNMVLQNQFGWIKPISNWQLEPYFLFDIGVQKSSGIGTHHQKALAYGVGINASHPHWRANVEWATGRAFGEQPPLMQERSVFASLSYLF
ncbi:hypothetical protein B0181_06610 [Moraxella caviae]|uniref:Hemolysin transporter protein shlB n=1 Tax=Moraxella caviae TaxID=34060 RepID=A0A1T0A1Q1_9GAMM|nr:ShlB/FhaC/HecB family hemolysin secretion/activation protein [Moraxella caviae]OOR89634.1 hypothetical protein B0181_06610 [Moraxella caviae]STZ10321.1 Hemolysin transporter protein shlB precursor [Moraxella caviae]